LNLNFELEFELILFHP